MSAACKLQCAMSSYTRHHTLEAAIFAIVDASAATLSSKALPVLQHRQQWLLSVTVSYHSIAVVTTTVYTAVLQRFVHRETAILLLAAVAAESKSCSCCATTH
eukprot:3009-Heterococcus_DN1.PRE.4